MRRPLFTIIAFAFSLAVVLAGMGWASWTALRLEREQAQARAAAALEEKVRLALWRMDSALLPLVSRESARPYYVYRAFYPAERTYTRLYHEIRFGDVLLPSPLLAEETKFVLLHFQFEPDGTLTSPQAPAGNMRDLAEARYSTPERVHRAEALLIELGRRLSYREALALAPSESMPAADRPLSPLARMEQRMDQMRQEAAQAQQYARNYMEALAREKATQSAKALPAKGGKSMEVQIEIQTLAKPPAPRPPETDLSEGLIKPEWHGPALLLLRRVEIEGRPYIQGCWLDWPAIRTWLLEGIGDLLPSARLAPASPGGANDQTRRLTALPLRLDPGETPQAPPLGVTPARVSLAAAWACVLLAAVAVGALMFGAVSLSERRAAFVSAVTHELRTPLTTFQMYSEMLAEKMAPEEKRERYLATLRAEALRLGHLVENVLSYARLERTRPKKRLEAVSLADVIARCRDRLAERAARSGMDLVTHGGTEGGGSQVAGFGDSAMRREPSPHTHPSSPCSFSVRADVSTVEQILFNLVDNACKYAGGAADNRIHIETACVGKAAQVRVRDHGPGIPAREARKLFRPFHKSAAQAAQTAPGVGLGLALSRRLARDMGGDLRLDHAAGEGACFVLTLPLIPPPHSQEWRS